MNLNKMLTSKLKEQTENRNALAVSEIPHYSTLLNVKKAAKLLVSLLFDGKKVLLVGDYDVDGIAASAILTDGMRKIGFTDEIFHPHIPSRLIDGYGLSNTIVEKAIREGYDVIVTVDNGVAAVEAIQMAKDAGIIVIVTDHHTAPSVLPNADVIVCPKQPGETYPFIEISGATVAWYFLAAIKDEVNFDLPMGQYLDLVALTIMSDVMPLDNVNLTLLEYGLKIIRSRKKFLYQLEWNPQWTSSEDIDETSLSFGLVPKINAVGRISDANIALRLLLSKDKLEIKELFQEITKINNTRKVMSRENTLEAEKIIDLDISSSDKKVIVVCGDYHEGVVGIIAGRLAEKYKKPAYVMSWNEEKQVWKGSARTSGFVHLYDITATVGHLTVGFGGHAGAVGFSLEDKNLEAFKEGLERVTSELDDEIFINHFLDPIECSISEINDETFRIVRDFGPYGLTNPMPSFVSEVRIVEASPLSNGLHWKCKLEDTETGIVIPAMMFNVHPDNVIKDNGGIQLTSDAVRLKYNLARTFDRHSEKFKIEIFASFL